VCHELNNLIPRNISIIINAVTTYFNNAVTKQERPQNSKVIEKQRYYLSCVHSIREAPHKIYWYVIFD